mgnify:CR=1 FL=1
MKRIAVRLNPRFEINGVLGSGGAGIVYKALDRELGEVVALKTMRPDAIDGEPNALERFRSEIRLARRISPFTTVFTPSTRSTQAAAEHGPSGVLRA